MNFKKHTRFENKKVLVLGLAMSGFAAAQLLAELGAFVTVNDAKPLEENPEAKDLIAAGIRVITGSHPLELLEESFAYLIKNPGIPYTNPMIKKALETGIPVLTEVELAAEILEADLIGITGTNGKTTTTAMTADILNQDRTAGKAYKAGNIGIPASRIAKEAAPKDDVVMELSSFQLIGIDQMRPHIAVITNLSEAHLDYHGSFEEYVKAKWRITKNQTADDYLVLNWDQEELRRSKNVAAAQIIPFSQKEETKEGVWLKDGDIYFREEKVMPASSLRVPGSHNLENALAAIAVGKLKGVANSAIETALANFQGVPHRIQYVAEIDGRTFYNDSKATNILAAKTALNSFPGKEIILLAGGLDRGNSFDELVPSLKQVKAMVVFGETAEKLKEAAEKAGIKEIKETENIQTAVYDSYSLSGPGDTILLSPACASWDQYQNFEVRGNEFIEAVKKLQTEKDEVNGPA